MNISSGHQPFGDRWVPINVLRCSSAAAASASSISTTASTSTAIIIISLFLSLHWNDME